MAEQTPAPRPSRAEQARNFLLYGFLISVVLHLLLGPLIHFNRTQAEEEKVETVKITKMKPPPTPSPTPKPTPTPPPTPTPKPATPPPKTQTPVPERPKIKIQTIKSHNTSSGPTEHVNANTTGSVNGVPKGNVESAPPTTATAPPVAHTAAPATPAPTPTPTPKPACAVPSAPPRVVQAATPETPDIAQQQGNGSGTVEVRVDLDANSHIVGTAIYRSTNPVLNQAALTATKQSTFQTEIVDCKPIAASYRFTVDFTSQ